MTEPLVVTLTIDLDKHLARSIGYDADGEPVMEPTTVEDVIVDAAARQFVAGLDRDTQRMVADRVSRITDEVIREQVTPFIIEAVHRSVQPTDGLGNPKGPTRTMAEVIVDHATKLLQANTDSYNRNKSGVVHEFIKAEVGAAFQKELKAVADAAKVEVLAAVKERGGEVLAQTIAAMAGTSR